MLVPRLFRSACRSTPRDTIFPYTTLFRSQHVVIAGRYQGNPGTERIVVLGLFHLHGGDERGRGQRYAPSRGDRKSTRLNSSHRCTSYAVFCLKKKKKSMMLKW